MSDIEPAGMRSVYGLAYFIKKVSLSYDITRVPLFAFCTRSVWCCYFKNAEWKFLSQVWDTDHGARCGHGLQGIGMIIPNGSSDCGCTPACWSYSSNPVLSASQGVTPTPVCISKRKQSWCSCLRSRRLRFVEPISEQRWHSRTIHQPLQCYDPNPHCRHVAFSTSAIPSEGCVSLTGACERVLSQTYSVSGIRASTIQCL